MMNLTMRRRGLYSLSIRMMASASIGREGSTNEMFKDKIRNAAKKQRENGDVGCQNKTSITLDILYDNPGALDNVIQCFHKHSVNMSSIDSRLRSFARDGPVFNIDFDGALSEPKVQTMLMDLRMHCAELQINEPRECDWFPMNIRDLDLTRETLDGGTDLINEDHPGFHDENYRKRREDIVQIAQDYRHGMEITKINYTENETKTWGVVYEKVMSMAQRYACREFLDIIPLMEQNCGYVHISFSICPQMKSSSLHTHTHTQLRR
jgi:predicted Zn-ribbon and HTH transcriptional regulator